MGDTLPLLGNELGRVRYWVLTHWESEWVVTTLVTWGGTVVC